MNLVYRIRAVFVVTLKRLWAQRGLTGATALGLVIAVALVTTVPLYADAVNFRVLQEQVGVQAEQRHHPAFAYLYSYVGSWQGAIEWEDVQALDDYFRGPAPADLGLPLQLGVRHFETDRFRLYPAGAGQYDDQGDGLAVVNLATTEGIADHIEIVVGRFPQVADPGPQTPIEVLVTEPFATQLGLQVGETFVAYNYREPSAPMSEIPIQIVGTWRPLDRDEAYWFFKPSVFDDLLLVPEATYVRRLAPLLGDEVYLAVWYLVMDGGEVRTDDVGRLVAGARRVERQVANLLPNTIDMISPVEALDAYRRAVGPLTILLTAYNVPVVALVLAFIALVVGLAVEQRRNEIAVMRSRGATPWQVLGFATLEGVLLGALAWALGTSVALGSTQLMGRARSFMDFSASAALRVTLNQAAFRAGGLAVGLALVAQVFPTAAASRDTIITYKQEQARSTARPWWQRAWLDLLLMIPAAYGFYLLQQQGSLVALGEEGAGSDPFGNPLLFLIPSLTIFALTLFFLRVLPWAMEGISWLLFKTDSVGALMAVRHLARAPRLYATPLILLVLTVSLSVFTASLAMTMDYQLYDDTLYRLGADLNLTGPGRALGGGGLYGMFTSQPDEPVSRALFLPMDEYLSFPGVEAASRVGRYHARAVVGGERLRGIFLGVDRATFGLVAFWRYDFAPYRLGSLLNALAATPEGVLVPYEFLRNSGLAVGDLVRLEVALLEVEVKLDAQVVGAFVYFPTWYPPENGALFVGNLDHLFELTGGEAPYDVWFRTGPGFDETAFGEAVAQRASVTWSYDEPYAAIEREQMRPERQGLFGLLSVGFMAAALVTVVGFFVYALFSFRRRFIELGILRAVGLSQRQMIVFVGCELGSLVVGGLVLGTLLGAWVSQLFVPYLKVGDSAAGLVPPYLVEIAWPAIFQIYLLFLLLFVLVLAVLGVVLRRIKVFQAIKLGETV
jgi:putative ABC transport system permease protein